MHLLPFLNIRLDHEVHWKIEYPNKIHPPPAELSLADNPSELLSTVDREHGSRDVMSKDIAWISRNYHRSDLRKRQRCLGASEAGQYCSVLSTCKWLIRRNYFISIQSSSASHSQILYSQIAVSFYQSLPRFKMRYNVMCMCIGWAVLTLMIETTTKAAVHSSWDGKVRASPHYSKRDCYCGRGLRLLCAYLRGLELHIARFIACVCACGRSIQCEGSTHFWT